MNTLMRPVLALCTTILLFGLTVSSSMARPPFETGDLKARDAQVCCSGTDASGQTIFFLAPQSQCPKNRVAPPQKCKSTPERQVCCLTHNGYFKTSSSRCKAAGGTVEKGRYCNRPNDPICCKTSSGYKKLTPNRCVTSGGAPANPRYCERSDRKVCCRTPNGYYGWTAAMCRQARGRVVNSRHCKRICCKYTKPDGTVVHEFQTTRRCKLLKGKKVGNRYCLKVNRDLKLKRDRDLRLRKN